MPNRGFDDIAYGSRRKRFLHKFLVVVNCEKDDLRFGSAACEQARGFQPAHHSHGNIKNQHVRFERSCRLKDGLAVVDSAHDLKL